MSTEKYDLVSQLVGHPLHIRPNEEAEICATRKRAREINELRLRRLQGVEHEYRSLDKHGVQPWFQNDGAPDEGAAPDALLLY